MLLSALIPLRILILQSTINKYSLILTRLMHRFPKSFLKLMASDENVLDRFHEVPAAKLSYKEYLQWMVSKLPNLLLRITVKRMLKWKDIG